MKQWFAVHTQPNGEVRAALNLERQGFEAYLPRHLKQRRHARKVERVARPLFPRYLFVRLDPEVAQWRAINGTFGVSHIVANGNTPAALPEGVVEEILARRDASGMVTIDTSPFWPGQRLEIMEGPMAMYTGLFQNMPDQDRVVLLLDLLGRPVRVTLPRNAVAAA